MMVTTEPASSTSPKQLDALLHHAAIAPLDDSGWLRVTGPDRVRWLNGMVTNSIQALTTGQGCYNFILNAQGRIQGTAAAFALEDSILLQTNRAQVPTLLALLDRFIIMDDVELTDATGEKSALALMGPEAATLLARIGIAPPPAALFLAQQQWSGQPLTVIAAHSPLVPRFELWATLETIANLAQTLTDTPSADPASLEALRILEGSPRYCTDIRDRDLPQETNQTRALHFAKGCYLGQEIVERIRSRGQVHRTFTGFRLVPDQPGDLPSSGTPLRWDGKPAGELTSVATVPLQTGPEHLALGYIRREALDRATPLTYPGGQAIPTTLPFAVP